MQVNWWLMEKSTIKYRFTIILMQKTLKSTDYFPAKIFNAKIIVSNKISFSLASIMINYKENLLFHCLKGEF
jgi:hypothetical protein